MRGPRGVDYGNLEGAYSDGVITGAALASGRAKKYLSGPDTADLVRHATWIGAPHTLLTLWARPSSARTEVFDAASPLRRWRTSFSTAGVGDFREW